MKIFLQVILFLPILAASQQLVAQGQITDRSILDPARSPDTTVEEQSQAEKTIRQIQNSASQPKNSLDWGLINKFALDLMAVEFQQEPSVMKELLKLTEEEFESILLILVDLRDQSAFAVRGQVISMCNRWNVDSNNNQLTMDTRISRAFDAYEDSENQMNLELTSTYFDALPYIYAEVGEESSRLIDNYLENTRIRLQNSVVHFFTDSSNYFGASAEATIKHHCEQ